MMDSIHPLMRYVYYMDKPLETQHVMVHTVYMMETLDLTIVY